MSFTPMKNEYDLVISVVNYNGGGYINKCFDLLLKACLKISGNIMIICVDNNSTDKSREIIDQYKEIEKIYLKQNIGFAAAHNLILRKYDSKYFLLLNPDTLMNDELNLVKMMDYMNSHTNIAIATCSSYNENNIRLPAIAHQPTLINGFAEQLKINTVLRRSSLAREIGKKSGGIFPSILNNFNSEKHLSGSQEVNYVYGAYLILRKSALDKIGIFDEHFFLFWEEIDLCIRAGKSGLKIGYNPDTSIIHMSQQSQKSVPELSYYCHIASYFWIFKKHYPIKLILWSIGTGVIQSISVLYKLITQNRKWMRPHLYLLLLSPFSTKNYIMQMNAIKKLYT